MFCNGDKTDAKNTRQIEPNWPKSWKEWEGWVGGGQPRLWPLSPENMWVLLSSSLPASSFLVAVRSFWMVLVGLLLLFGGTASLLLLWVVLPN